MGEKHSKAYTIGDAWLTKRRDGKSPGIWQIARYASKSRSVVYRSTKCQSLDDAIAFFHAEDARQRAKGSQPADEAMVVPQLILYYEEHGENAINAVTIAGSIRHFIAFLAQTDDLGATVTVADLRPPVFERFRKWRMGPHGYELSWRGKVYKHSSPGITGETVQRNFNDVGAALNHAAANDRIPYAPKIKGVEVALRSRPRDVQLTVAQLGAALGYAAQSTDATGNPDPSMLRWIQLMIATGARPDACLAFDPAKQDMGDLIDMHPAGAPRTKKRNPVVPVIAPLRTVLDAWKAAPHPIVTSRRTAWRTMRRALGWPANIVPKTVRHTVATQLRRRGVPFEDEIRPLLGHAPETGITAVYAKYDPAYLAKAKAALTTLFEEASAAAATWTADHMRTKVGNNRSTVIDRTKKKVQKT